MIMFKMDTGRRKKNTHLKIDRYFKEIHGKMHEILACNSCAEMTSKNWMRLPQNANTNNNRLIYDSRLTILSSAVATTREHRRLIVFEFGLHEYCILSGSSRGCSSGAFLLFYIYSISGHLVVEDIMLRHFFKFIEFKGLKISSAE